MEINLLKVLVDGLSSFLNLSFSGDVNSEPVSKYYQKAEEILKLLKPIIDAIVNSELASDEELCKIFEEVSQAVDELREVIESWHLLSSKVYFVVQIESLISRIRTFGLNIFPQLKVLHQCLPDEFNTAQLEHYVQKLKNLGHEEISSVINEAVKELADGVGPSSEVLAKMAEAWA